MNGITPKNSKATAKPTVFALPWLILVLANIDRSGLFHYAAGGGGSSFASSHGESATHAAAGGWRAGRIALAARDWRRGGVCARR